MRNSSSRSAGGSTMTRRQLLQRLGVVGGSSLVFGAMNSLDLMAAPIGSRPVLRGRQEGVRVIVLGAGVSGLVTGYELGKLGYDYQILEARDRVGGLNWSVTRGSEHTELGRGGERQVCRFDEGQYFNAGPWRIPHTHHGLLGYCKELGVRMEEFNDVEEVMFSEDPSLGALTGTKVRMHELQSDLWGQASELLAKALDQGSLDTPLSVEDEERLVEFLVGAGYLNRADLIYQPDEEARGTIQKYDLTLLLQAPFIREVRSVMVGTGGPDPVFQPTGGMMQIPLAFERVLRDRITLQAQVLSVRQSDDEVRVVYQDRMSGAQEELVADHVVCCLPMSILQKIDINFSPAMAEAVDAQSHSGSSKMGIQTARRFWEEDDAIYGGHMTYFKWSQEEGRTTRPIPQFSYPSNDYASKKGVLLGFYGNGEIPGLDGRPLLESSVQARIEHVVTHASAVHPQLREEFESAYAVWWPKVPFSEGAWASNPREYMEQFAQADGRLYIGSAGTSDHPAWQEGAVQAAWRTVETLHGRVMNASG